MTSKITTLSRNLRKNQTNAERLLWTHIRMKQIDGFKFRRRQPIGKYIVDFVCFERKVVIEVDGSMERDLRFYGSGIMKSYKILEEY